MENSLSPLLVVDLYTLGAVRITAHGLFFAFGVGGALWVLWRRHPVWFWQYSWPTNVAIIYVCSMIAARAGYLLLYRPQATAIGYLQYWQGGLLSYTGYAAGFFLCWLWIRRLHSVWRLDITYSYILAWLTGVAISRIGNFLDLESYGRQSNWFSFTYGRIPIQLGETLLCMALVLWAWKRQPTWQLAWFLPGLAFLGRGLLDIFREETVLWVTGYSAALSLSIGFICLFMTYIKRSVHHAS
jgi:prolipoprotein diacylglyceryltransferase